MKSQIGCGRMAAFAEQRTPLHVQCHAMRRHVAGMMQWRVAAQQDSCAQPVGGWDECRCGFLEPSGIEQAGDIGPGWNNPTLTSGCRSCASYAQETVADREA